MQIAGYIALGMCIGGVLSMLEKLKVSKKRNVDKRLKENEY